jgi:hypothetical protein
VHALRPGPELGHRQSRHRGRALVQHRDLLLGGEAAKEVIGSLAEREGRIVVANRFDCYLSQP